MSVYMYSLAVLKTFHESDSPKNLPFINIFCRRNCHPSIPCDTEGADPGAQACSGCRVLRPSRFFAALINRGVFRMCERRGPRVFGLWSGGRAKLLQHHGMTRQPAAVAATLANG